MPARDMFHHAVRRALETDGWTITDDPLHVEFGKDEMWVDLAAERVLAAEKGELKIAVEIKSFIGTSILYEFHQASGQYRNYERVLRLIEPERTIYLAVTEDAHHLILQSDVACLAIEEDKIKCNCSRFLVAKRPDIAAFVQRPQDGVVAAHSRLSSEFLWFGRRAKTLMDIEL